MSVASIRPIYLTNTLSGKKELLETKEPGKLTFYSCGPTVYDLIHIGNLRGALVSDLFYRYFRRVGYQVVYVRNYTDIDDKIIKKSHEEQLSWEVIARKYTQEVEKDFAVVQVLQPTHVVRATEHIGDMIDLVSSLIDKKAAYVAADGEVLFAIDQFPSYGKLSHRCPGHAGNTEGAKVAALPEENGIGSRIQTRLGKRNPLDFTLWKPMKPGEPFWESPWGRGRPGWHIECSAMASRWLGNCIDVHHGGEDLIFPHHENEIAQSEMATGDTPYVRYWVHHAFLTLSQEKMSKSLGNTFTAREFLTQFSGEVARFLLLSVHYRSRIDFTTDTLFQAIAGLRRIYEAKSRAVALLRQGRARSDLRAEGAWGSFLASCQQTQREMDEHYAHDLNTPGVLASVFLLIRDWNRTLTEPCSVGTPSAILGATELIRILEEDLGGILGVGRLEPEKALSDLDRIEKAEKSAHFLSPQLSESDILRAIEERNQARQSRDFARADAIRKELAAQGVSIQDQAQGTIWEYS